MIKVEEIINIIQNKYDGIILKDAYKEKTFFFNPDNRLKNGVYFCTIKENDGPNDKSSKLYRENIYRISCSIDIDSYEKLFGKKPKRASKGKTVILDNSLNIKFDDINVIMPHPIYAWMGWISINSPSENKFIEFLNFIDISYKKSKEKYAKKFVI